MAVHAPEPAPPCPRPCLRTSLLQADVAPAAAQLAKGQLSVEAFNEQFTLEKIRDLAVNTTL